jgi:hypothetical protein
VRFLAGVAAMAIAAMFVAAGAPADAPPIAAPCAAAQLRAVYTVVPFSQGAGNVAYLLTVSNHSTQTCAVAGPLPVQLLDRRGRPLGTHATVPAGDTGSDDGSGSQLVLAPGQWAQADSLLRPDIAGPGESPSECEPPAHFLALAIGGDRVTAPMDPSPVCENGTIGFGRLIAVSSTPVCAAASLTASFDRAAPPYQGATAYYLELTNAGDQACHTPSFARLRLLDAAGDPLPTRMMLGVSSPYVIPSGADEYAVATLHTSAGPGEPDHGPCEPLAAEVRVILGRRSGSLTVPIEPALHACHGGAISLSGLYPAGS